MRGVAGVAFTIAASVAQVGRWRMNVFGLDIGGSGIKGAPVDTRTGKLVGERIRVPTPKAGRPDEVVATAVKIISRAGWDGPVGVGFPGS